MARAGLANLLLNIRSSATGSTGGYYLQIWLVALVAAAIAAGLVLR
jgi:hypothetical protein